MLESKLLSSNAADRAAASRLICELTSTPEGREYLAYGGDPSDGQRAGHVNVDVFSDDFDSSSEYRPPDESCGSLGSATTRERRDFDETVPAPRIASVGPPLRRGGHDGERDRGHSEGYDTSLSGEAYTEGADESRRGADRGGMESFDASPVSRPAGVDGYGARSSVPVGGRGLGRDDDTAYGTRDDGGPGFESLQSPVNDCGSCRALARTGFEAFDMAPGSLSPAGVDGYGARSSVPAGGRGHAGRDGDTPYGTHADGGAGPEPLRSPTRDFRAGDLRRAVAGPGFAGASTFPSPVGVDGYGTRSYMPPDDMNRHGGEYHDRGNPDSHEDLGSGFREVAVASNVRSESERPVVLPVDIVTGSSTGGGGDGVARDSYAHEVGRGGGPCEFAHADRGTYPRARDVDEPVATSGRNDRIVPEHEIAEATGKVSGFSGGARIPYGGGEMRGAVGYSSPQRPPRNEEPPRCDGPGYEVSWAPGIEAARLASAAPTDLSSTGQRRSGDRDDVDTASTSRAGTVIDGVTDWHRPASQLGNLEDILLAGFREPPNRVRPGPVPYAATAVRPDAASAHSRDAREPRSLETSGDREFPLSEPPVMRPAVGPGVLLPSEARRRLRVDTGVPKAPGALYGREDNKFAPRAQESALHASRDEHRGPWRGPGREVEAHVRSVSPDGRGAMEAHYAFAARRASSLVALRERDIEVSGTDDTLPDVTAATLTRMLEARTAPIRVTSAPSLAVEASKPSEPAAQEGAVPSRFAVPLEDDASEVPPQPRLVSPSERGQRMQDRLRGLPADSDEADQTVAEVTPSPMRHARPGATAGASGWRRLSRRGSNAMTEIAAVNAFARTSGAAATIWKSILVSEVNDRAIGGDPPKDKLWAVVALHRLASSPPVALDLTRLGLIRDAASILARIFATPDRAVPFSDPWQQWRR